MREIFSAKLDRKLLTVHGGHSLQMQLLCGFSFKVSLHFKMPASEGRPEDDGVVRGGHEQNESDHHVAMLPETEWQNLVEHQLRIRTVGKGGE